MMRNYVFGSTNRISEYKKGVWGTIGYLKTNHKGIRLSSINYLEETMLIGGHVSISFDR